jgi:hypothetical protein
MAVVGNYLKKLVGRDGIEPPTPGFSVLVPTRAYGALSVAIGPNPGISEPGVPTILPDSLYSHSIVLTQN